MTPLRSRVLEWIAACLLLGPTSAVACAPGADGAAVAPLLAELVVTSDRGDAFDRSFRLRVHADGCLALRRPAFHREPGEHAGLLDPAALQAVRALAARPELAVIDPAAALARAQAEFAQDQPGAAGRAAPPRATHVSHPTWYRLRLFDGGGGLAHELRMESILQHADLHPQDAELGALAAAVRQLLDLAETTPTRRLAAEAVQP